MERVVIRQVHGMGRQASQAWAFHICLHGDRAQLCMSTLASEYMDSEVLEKSMARMAVGRIPRHHVAKPSSLHSAQFYKAGQPPLNIHEENKIKRNRNLATRMRQSKTFL